MEDLNAGRMRTHKIIMTDRNVCNITGVCDVLSFDVAEVLLETEHRLQEANGVDSILSTTAEQVIKLLRTTVVIYQVSPSGRRPPRAGGRCRRTVPWKTAICLTRRK